MIRGHGCGHLRCAAVSVFGAIDDYGLLYSCLGVVIFYAWDVRGWEIISCMVALQGPDSGEKCMVRVGSPLLGDRI